MPQRPVEARQLGLVDSDRRSGRRGQRRLEQAHHAFQRENLGAQLVHRRAERAQFLGCQPAAGNEQRLRLVGGERTRREEDLARSPGAPVLCQDDARLRRCGLRALPELPVAPRQAGGLCRQLVGLAKDLPQLDGPEHPQQSLGIARDLLRRRLHQHLVPCLLVLVPREDHGLAVRLREEVGVDVQRQAGRLFRGQERVEASLGQQLRFDAQANPELGAAAERRESGMRVVEPPRGLGRVGAEDVPVLDLSARSEADDEIGSVASVQFAAQQQGPVPAYLRATDVAQEKQAVPQHALEVLGHPVDVGGADVGHAQSQPRLGIRVPGPWQEERRVAGVVVRLFDEPLPRLRDEGQPDACGADLRMVRYLVGRQETDAETPDVLAPQQLSAAAHVGDAVVVAGVVRLRPEAARTGVQIAAVGEHAAVAHHESVVGDVEDDLVRLRVVGVLDQLQGHHVVALEPGQVAADVAKEVRGVRPALPGTGRPKHCCPWTPQSQSSRLQLVALAETGPDARDTPFGGAQASARRRCPPTCSRRWRFAAPIVAVHRSRGAGTRRIGRCRPQPVDAHRRLPRSSAGATGGRIVVPDQFAWEKHAVEAAAVAERGPELARRAGRGAAHAVAAEAGHPVLGEYQNVWGPSGGSS